MTQALGQLRLDLVADWASLRTQAERSADSLARFGSKFGGVARTVGQAALGMATAAAGAFTTFALLSVQAAEEAEGIRSAFRSSFGDAADAADQWATETAASLRLSQRDIRETATQFQNLFGEIAPTNDAAAEASMRFTELARDFAALKNIRVEESVRLFTSALAGSTRGVRAYGIDISEATVRQEALTRGIITADQELSQEQATLVRASILMRELGDATGATADSTDDAEAATQRARAAYEDASESLGTSLLPAMTTLKNLFADVVRGISEYVSTAIPNFITSNDAVLARMVQLREAFRGNLRSIEEVQAAVTRYRAGNQGQVEENAATGESIRGLTNETSTYSDTLANLATQVSNGGRRGGGRTRTWAEEHAAEIARLREQIDPLGVALERFAQQSQIAARAGLDVAAAQRAMAREIIESQGGLEAFQDKLEQLPEAFRQAAADIEAAELAEQAEETREELERFAETVNDRFDGESAMRAEINQLNAALAAGLINAETYREALDEITGVNEKQEEFAQMMADQAAERDKQWSNVADTIADVATGTRDLEDAWKDLILQFIRAQMIEPFLNRLFQGGKGGGGIIGGIFNGGGGGGGIFDALAGLFNFGGGKAGGGDVFAGMAYEVGERGRELFVPKQDGTIMPHGSYGGNQIINVYTPDANSFRASRRQIARESRRGIGVQ